MSLAAQHWPQEDPAPINPMVLPLSFCQTGQSDFEHVREEEETSGRGSTHVQSDNKKKTN